MASAAARMDSGSVTSSCTMCRVPGALSARARREDVLAKSRHAAMTVFDGVCNNCSTRARPMPRLALRKSGVQLIVMEGL